MHDSNHEHDCSRVIAKVILALDGELTTEEEQKFMEEIKICSHCLERFSIGKTFKSFLNKRIKRKKVPEKMVNSIRKKIKILALEE